MTISQEKRLFGVGFIYSFCIALAAYVNASYLKLFLNTESVGLVYSATALLTILVLYFFEHLGGKYGVQKTLISSLIIASISALMMFILDIPYLIIISFIIMQVSLVITKFSTDVLLETHKNTNIGEGALRGAYLAITNFSWIIAAFIGGYIASINPKYIYGINSFVYITLSIIVLFIISQTKKDIINKSSIFEKLKIMWEEKNTRHVIVSEFILQTFYTVMIIFSPLYLREILGFSYKEIGIMFSIMLIPFAVLQYPLGKLADEKYGEKEMMAISYVVISLAVYLFITTRQHTFFTITAILFLSRIGACTLEVMNDTYFFTVSKEYKKTLPVLKGMAPFALLLFGTIGSTIITFYSYKILFLGLSVFVVVLGLANIYKMKDTK
jgi:MFS family permease